MRLRSILSVVAAAALGIGFLPGVANASQPKSFKEACPSSSPGIHPWDEIEMCVSSKYDVLHIGTGRLPNLYIENDYAERYGATPWAHYRKSIKKVVFHGKAKSVKTRDSIQGLFLGMPELTSIENAAALDVSGVEDMSEVFRGAKALTSVDVSSWNTKDATNMRVMFDGTKALKSLNLSKWNTGKVTDTSYMFRGMTSLTNLNLSGWDTRRASTINMVKMFDGSKSITNLRLGAKTKLNKDCALQAPKNSKYSGKWTIAERGGKPVTNSKAMTNAEMISQTGSADTLYKAQPASATNNPPKKPAASTTTTEVTDPTASPAPLPPERPKPGRRPEVAEKPRLSGHDRFETAVQISRYSFEPGVPIVFIASALNFPDALSAAASAASLNAPVLLVNSTVVPENVKEELTRLSPTQIMIVGGTQTVNPKVQSELTTYASKSVDRISGDDRFGTAAQISGYSFNPGVPVVYVAGGMDFPDALAASAPAGNAKGPVLLVGKDTVPDSVDAELKRLAPRKIVVVGGNNTLSEHVKEELRTYTKGTVERHGGENRLETAAQISARYFGENVPVAYIASGHDFPDALTAGAVAGAQGGPVLLATKNSTPEAVKIELTRLKPKKVIVVGGLNSVSQEVLQEVLEYETGGK